MTLDEFEAKIQSVCVKNGWYIRLEAERIWHITVYDKETGQDVASSGSTGLFGILELLETPLEDSLAWVKA